MEIDPAVRRALDTIDTLLVSLGPSTQGRVIDVLAALRGPDSQNIHTKHTSTNFVRRIAFPLLCDSFAPYEHRGIGRWDVQLEGTLPVVPKVDKEWHRATKEEPYHFVTHIVSALRALGFDYPTPNSPWL